MSQVQIASKSVGPVGYGMMNLTWKKTPPPQSQSFSTMRAALANGANLWNASEFYGTPERNSCHLLNEYFTKYPEDAEKVVLNIKGCVVPGQMKIDGSEAGVRRSVEDSLKVLGGKKSIDIFESARVDPNVPIEETVRFLHELQKEGKIGAIGLSEVSANSIRRAAAVAPIATVEVELSLWATDILRNGIASTCAELGIPITAYSPLGRGALTGEIFRKNADIPEDDHRKHLPKFQDDVLEANNKVTDEIEKLARRKGCTKPQIALAWVARLSNGVLPDGTRLGTIIPIPGASAAERVEENMRVVQLTDEEMKEIAEVLEANPITGDRYPPAAQKLSEY